MSRPTCPGCGSSPVKAVKEKPYHYKQSGLDDVYLNGGVSRIECPACHNVYHSIDNEWQLLQVIALALLTKRERLTGAEQKYLRKACAMTQQDLAAKLNCRRATIAERETRRNRGLDPQDDFLLRAVILVSFMSLLEDPEEDFLAEEHHQILAAFASDFYKRAQEIVATAQARSRKICEAREHWDCRLQRA